jgi:uncharacterized protein YggT (Ycf19 family)
MLFFLPPTNLFFILADILEIVVLLIFVEVIRSIANVMGVRNTSSYTPWVRTLHKIVLPILDPFRRLWDAIVNSFSGRSGSGSYALRRFDLSPMLAIIAIEIAQGFLTKLGVQSMMGH